MPSSSPVLARQPSLASRLTSSSFRGVPCCRETDPAGIADGSSDHAGEFGDGDVLVGADIDQLIAGTGLHQMDAGISPIEMELKAA
jgi:hypothetical protein